MNSQMMKKEKLFMDNSYIISKIQEFQYDLGNTLCHWLASSLPDINDNWWYSIVLNCLSDMQQKAIRDKKIDSLEGLDLAALLKVIDKNWYRITSVHYINIKYREKIKDMMRIRNNWAHISYDEITKNDVLNSAEVIYELLCAFDGPKENRKKVTSFISSLKDDNNYSDNIVDSAITPIANKSENSEEIKIGTIVSLVADPNVSGAVVAISGNQYTLFINNSIQNFYKEQIIIKSIDKESPYLSLEKLKIAMSAYQIYNTKNNSLYSLNAAKIDFVPYQFRPALKMVNSDVPRILIADDVGVGKTIESGLIIKELESRGDIESILIICPRALVVENKWKNEMKKFDEDFVELDTKLFKQCLNETQIDGEWPDRYKKAIISYSVFTDEIVNGSTSRKNRTTALTKLENFPQFDLVIVDEAHHIRNSNTLMYQATELFCSNANATIFLTATPIQNGSVDLFTLLNILRPDIIYDKESFSRISEPNKYINKMLSLVRNMSDNWKNEFIESMNAMLSTQYGKAVISKNPVLHKIQELFSKDTLSREDKIQLISYIEEMHTFSSFLNRTRRRDIDDFCIRRTETITSEMTKPQSILYNTIIQFESKALRLLHNTNNVFFMMCTILRQAASSLYGLAPFLNSFINRRIGQVITDGEIYENDVIIDEETKELLIDLSSKIEELSQSLGNDDPKFENLYTIVKKKASDKNNKIILFSSFRYTLKYLSKRLTEKNIRCAIIDGSIPDDERKELTARFKLDKDNSEAIDVMLFSEVGCEGLDYQFCDTLVNYDLPWNPMRIEQRIGRIDRRGQKSDTVKIYNLVTNGTIDSKIYDKCLAKIGVFENSIGDCAEILGDINHQINAIMFDPNLTDEERIYKIEKLADNKILLINEIRSLEDKEKDLYGFNITKEAIAGDVQNSENEWITPENIYRLVNTYLNDYLGEGEYILGKNEAKTLKLSYENRSILLNSFKNLKKKNTRSEKYWKQYLKNTNNPLFKITFDSTFARDHEDYQFITSLHPLVQCAAEYEKEKIKCTIYVDVTDQSMKPGSYPFIIYSWHYKGIKERYKLTAVSENSDIEQRLIELISYGKQDISTIKTDDTVWKKLEHLHYQKWLKEREDYIKDTVQQCEYRKERSIESCDTRKEMLKDIISKCEDERILRMRQSQIEKLDKEVQQKTAFFSNTASKADIHFELLIKGIIKVNN